MGALGLAPRPHHLRLHFRLCGLVEIAAALDAIRHVGRFLSTSSRVGRYVGRTYVTVARNGACPASTFGVEATLDGYRGHRAARGLLRRDDSCVFEGLDDRLWLFWPG